VSKPRESEVVAGLKIPSFLIDATQIGKRCPSNGLQNG